MIESVNNETIKNLRKLKDKKYRDETGLYIIEGEHLVIEASKTKNLVKIITTDDSFDFGVEKILVSDNVIKTLSELNNTKLIGIVRKSATKLDLTKNVVILDGVQDPGNLGTIIRSSVAFNIDNIVLSNTSVDLYNTKSLRSAQGMNFHVNIIRDDLVKVINELKENDYVIYGTNVINGIDVKSVNKDRKYAIILGNEGSGISSEVSSLVDQNIYIKMNEKCESLNVGASASIILYELEKK